MELRCRGGEARCKCGNRSSLKLFGRSWGERRGWGEGGIDERVLKESTLANTVDREGPDCDELQCQPKELELYFRIPAEVWKKQDQNYISGSSILHLSQVDQKEIQELGKASGREYLSR